MTFNKGPFQNVAGLALAPSCSWSSGLLYLALSVLGPVEHVLLLAVVEVETWGASMFTLSRGSRSRLPIFHWPTQVTQPS